MFIIIYCSDFTLFVLCYGFLISFIFQSVPILYSTTIFLCHPTMHMLSVTYTRAGLRFLTLLFLLLLLLLLLWICLNNHILHFLSFPFSNITHADVLVCLATTHARISSHSNRLSSELHWLLPPNHSHQPYWLAPRYWELTNALRLPYINSFNSQISFWILDPWR